ncbi:hypothetical protein D043_4297B, partial [Vibrio parahaemolyticus EKP-021]
AFCFFKHCFVAYWLSFVEIN